MSTIVSPIRIGTVQERSPVSCNAAECGNYGIWELSINMGNITHVTRLCGPHMSVLWDVVDAWHKATK